MSLHDKDPLGVDSVVLTIEGFNYNPYDICLNPDVALINEKRKLFYELRIAKNKHGWGYGVSYNCNSILTGAGCGGFGVWLNDPGYRTALDAKIAGATYIAKAFECFLKEVPQLRKHQSDLKSLYTAIEDWINELGLL